tara:strand:+ start:356 stop:805 length:450 start_codon:yes stop_codon:yes gene_type:complete
LTDAAIRGTYADLKFIKSRKVVQMVVEVPIEAGGALVEAFGVPRPDEEVWVAVALLRSDEDDIEIKPNTFTPTPFHELPRTQQAGILCADERFQKWLGARSQEHAASVVKRKCGITSRRRLNDGDGARDWDKLVEWYRAQTGQSTEERG